MRATLPTLAARGARLGGGLSVLVLVTAAICILAPAASGSAVPSGTMRPLSVECPALVATPWQLPYPPYTKGDKYDVTAHQFSCGQVDHYVKILTANKVVNPQPSLVPPSTPPSTVKGGPKGFSCRSIADKSGRAYDGGCYTYSNGLANMDKPWFAWTVG